MRVKKPKKPEKSARENEILPVKKTKNWQKKAFTPTFFFTPKKKTLLSSRVQSGVCAHTEVMCVVLWGKPLINMEL